MLFRGTFGFWFVAKPVIPIVERLADGSFPSEYSMNDGYPNPISASNRLATIEFSVPEYSHVTVKTYALSGHEIQTIIDENLDPGVYIATLDTKNWMSGVYINVLRAIVIGKTEKCVVRKMLIVK